MVLGPYSCDIRFVGVLWASSHTFRKGKSGWGALWASVRPAYFSLYRVFGRDASVGALEETPRRHRKASLRPWLPRGLNTAVF